MTKYTWQALFANARSAILDVDCQNYRLVINLSCVEETTLAGGIIGIAAATCILKRPNSY